MLLNVETYCFLNVETWIGLGWETYFTKNTASRPFAGGLRITVCHFKFWWISREFPNLAGDTFLFSMDVSLYLYYFVILYQKIVLVSHSGLDFHRRYYILNRRLYLNLPYLYSLQVCVTTIISTISWGWRLFNISTPYWVQRVLVLYKNTSI